MGNLKRSNGIAIVLVYAMLMASRPLPAFAAVPVATSFSVTASTVGNKAITLQGSDADGTALTFALLSQPTHGAISGFSASTGALIYTPAFGYSGADSFTFRVTSGGQDSNTATVSITVAADKTRVIDYVTDAGGVGQVGKVTFVLTATSSTGGGLISPASSVTAQTDATGKYDTSVIASVNLSPKSYYQVYFQTNYSDRRLLGVYDIPVSATPIVLQSYKVTDTNLAARYTFADKASVDSLQTANANAVFQSLLPSGMDDGRVIGYDSSTGRMKASAIRETASKIELAKPLGTVTADSVTATHLGDGSALTNIVSTGVGGSDSEGSLSMIANKNGASPGAILSGAIGATGSRVTVYEGYTDRFKLLKPLELPSSDASTAPANTLLLDSALKRPSYNLNGVKIPLSPFVDIRWHGCKCDGSTDDTLNLQTAITSAAGKIVYIPDTGSDCKVTDEITLPSEITIIGWGRGRIKQFTSGKRIFVSTTAGAKIKIEGVKFTGTGTVTYGSNDYGLIYVANAASAIFQQNVVDTCYSCLVANNSDFVRMVENEVSSFRLFATMASGSRQFNIDSNKIYGSVETGQANSYGVHATGNEAGGLPQNYNTISFNTISGVPSWDGIMTHEARKLKIIGNIIVNVRSGIDVTANPTNVLEDIEIAFNTCTATLTENWSVGSPAINFGIAVIGGSSTNLAKNVRLTGNSVSGFLKLTHPPTVNQASIILTNVDGVTASGNHILDGGNGVAAGFASGLQIGGVAKNVSIPSLQILDALSQHGISIAYATAENISIGQVNFQTSYGAGDIGVYVSPTSTIVNLNVGEITTNADYSYLADGTISGTKSNRPFVQFGGGAILTKLLTGSYTWAGNSFTNGQTRCLQIATTGAVVGDLAWSSINPSSVDFATKADVLSAGIVNVCITNYSGGSVTLPSTIIKTGVVKLQ